MKTLLVANRKGGVGKSAVCCQLAYYFADKLGLRVLLLDLDNQGNTTKAVRTSGLASVSDTVASQLFEQPGTTVEAGPFVLVPADDKLAKLERQAAQHNAFAGNFRSFLQSVAGDFDVCLIDTNPTPDIRVTSALVSASHVLAPIQLNQEAIDGIGSLIREVKTVQANAERLRANVQLLGVLPNLVEPTPFQRANAQLLFKHFPGILIQLPGGGFAQIKRSTAIPEAQAAGKPLWKASKTSSRDLWREVEPTFKHIAEKMEVSA